MIRTILREDSLAAFECSLQENRENLEDQTRPLGLTLEMVNIALQAISLDVFPHCALAIQKL